MENTAPKPFVFVLMPFAPEFDDVYKLGIKTACNNAGAYAERVDEQSFQESILDRIYNQIAKADVIVADMTGRSPNVFYETGYAHALGKLVILLTQNAEDIPFDLKHYSHIVYEGKIADKLLPELEKKVRWALEHPISERSQIEHFPLYYIDGAELIPKSTHKSTVKRGKSTESIDELGLQNAPSALIIKIDIFNPIDKYLNTLYPRYALKSMAKFFYNRTIIKLPDGFFLYQLQDIRPIPPGEWVQLYIELTARSQHIPYIRLLQFTLVEYLDAGIREISFFVDMENSSYE